MKKLNRLSAIIALILIAAFILPSTAVIATANDSNLVYFYGDLNANGEIDKFDYILIKRSCMNTLSLTDEQISRGDVNNNGDIDKFDYILVKRHVMGTYEIPPIETGCDHTYILVVTPPTGTEQGFTTHICEICGYSYIDSYTKPTASEGLAYSVNNDGITCTVTGIGSCGDLDLIIPSEIDSYKVTSIGDRAFYECKKLTSITIPDSVTSIGDYAFYWCYNLTSVTIGNGVTSIGDWAFYYCNNLTSITIPDSVTSIGDYAFGGCTSLTSVTIGNSVTSIGDRAFYYCNNLTSITIPDSVTSIGDRAFDNCNNLTSVTIGNSVTSIGDYAFYNCYDLTSVTIGNSVTSIGKEAFAYCRNLSSITIPNSVTSIGEDAFFYCTGLKSITIPDSVTSIGSFAFGECAHLEDIYYQGNVENWLSIQFEGYTSNPCRNGANLYFNDVLVTELVVPDSVTSIGDYAFCKCTKLTSITIPDSVISIGDYAFDGCTSLTSITIPDSVSSIGDYAFDNCDNLKDVYYAGSQEEWKQIERGYGNSDLTFATIHYNCKFAPNGSMYAINDDGVTCTIIDVGTCGDSDLIIPSEINGYKVISIGDYAFGECDNLTSVTVGNGVTSIGDFAFEGCASLTSINIPDSVTSIGSGAFDGCSSLKYNPYDNAYYLGNVNNPYVVLVKAISEDITSCTINPNTKFIHSDAFYNCTGLTSITIPDSVAEISYEAFRYCTALTSVIIPDSVTSIGGWAFNGCSNLKDVYYAGSQEEWKQIEIGSGNSRLTSATIHYNCKNASSGLSFDVNEDGISCTITGIGTCSDTDLIITSKIDGYKVISIGDYAFEGCTSLTSVTIGNSVTSIGNNAFGWCKALTSITISDSVTSIGKYAFDGCYNLKDVYYAGSQEEWKQIGIGGYNSYLTSATIHYNSK